MLAGVIGLILAPLIGDAVFTNLWGVEPFAYIGAVLVIAGLGVTTLSYVVPNVTAGKSARDASDRAAVER